MKEWRRKAKGCGCLLLFLVAMPLFLLKACQWSDAHPTDSAMVQEFTSNGTTFLELLKLVKEETRVTRVADDFIWIDGMNTVSEGDRSRYLPDARWRRYRTLFKKLKLESGVIRYEDGSAGFLRSSSGMATSGSSKEFVWSTINPQVVASDGRSLEEACVPKTGCRIMRRIAPEWYIAFESD